MNKLWLPEGHHWGLNISRHRLEDAGSFTGGGYKLIWHTTEGPTIDGAYATLRSNRDAPNFIIDPHHSVAKVIQTISLDHAARALQHTFDPPTNTANCIQVEIVGYTRESGDWGEAVYEHLAALACLIDHRVQIPRTAPVSFASPHRLSPSVFVRASGHLGHVHVPGNTHTDPGKLRIGLLFSKMHNLDARYK